MNILVAFLLVSTVIMTLGEARRLPMNPEVGKKINPEETGEDLPSNLRSIRVAGETWPRLDFMERTAQSLREVTADEAERLVSDFWKNFGNAAENFEKEDDMTLNENENEEVSPAIVSPSLSQAKVDNTERESPIANNEEEEVDTAVDDANLVVNNENKNQVIVESRASSHNAPEEIRIPMVNGQSLPPYSTPPRNEYLNRGPVPYPNPQPNQPYPIVFPSPVLTQPRLPFGYPQNGPPNPVYMPTNRSPYHPQQYYPPGNNFRGVPVNLYDPNTNRMVTVLIPASPQGYPIFDPNPVPMQAFGLPSGQQAPLPAQGYALQPQPLQTDMTPISTPVTPSGYPVYDQP